MIASRPSTSATLSVSASIGGSVTTHPVAVAPASVSASRVWLSAASERSSQSLRTASRSTSLITSAGEAITSPAASEPMADSIRAAASSSGSSTW